MNCIECRDELVARIEGLLGDEESLQCQAHLETCAACRAEYAAFANLHQQLVARSHAAADVSIVEPVMRRVLAVHAEPEKDTIMSILQKHRWGLGLGAMAGAVAIILAALLSVPKTQAAAVVVMTKGAEAAAKLTSIHLRGQVRTPTAENFGYPDPASDFVSIELWKQFEPDLKWRVEKPGRVAVMDGQSTVLYVKPLNMGMKVPQPSSSAFDTGWLHKIANLSNTITQDRDNAIAKGWKLNLAEEQAADGRAKSVVTIQAKSDLPDSDYLKNQQFDYADTRRVYRFDAQTGLLEAVGIYLTRNSGDVLIFEVNQIDYNRPIDPAVFRLDLPANVNWYQEPQKLTDNEKYAAMTAQQAARSLFEACGREDWTEAAKFFPMPIPETLKQFLGGCQIVSLGEPFTSQGAGPTDQFVPYEIRLKTGETHSYNLHLRKDPQTGRWFWEGGI
ncbi:MAG: zf-HC2 domain-containing protein [Verrucomicrobiia bacterium]